MKTDRAKTESLILEIKNKCGTLTNFCKATGYDRYKIQLLFANCRKNITHERKSEMEAIKKALKAINSGLVITDDMRERLTAKTKEVGRQTLADMAGVSRSFVVEIMNGTIKNQTSKVKKLFREWV